MTFVPLGKASALKPRAVKAPVEGSGTEYHPEALLPEPSIPPTAKGIPPYAEILAKETKRMRAKPATQDSHHEVTKDKKMG